MTEKIKEYVEDLLKDAPRTRRVVDLQEELLSGCLDKYADLIASRVEPEAAYEAVIEGIGDVDELLGSAGKITANKKMLGPMSSSLWSIITLIYLCFGFLLDLWHPGWMIFLVGALLQNLLSAAFTSGRARRGSLTASLYVGAAFFFLGFGFATDMWTYAVLVFVLAIVIQQITRLIRLWRDDS
jgi:hypothetical protein